MNTAVCENQTAAPPKSAARRNRPDDPSASDIAEPERDERERHGRRDVVEYGLNSAL